MQEIRDMSTNEKGSDLDVFEGLSKKGSGLSSPPAGPQSPPPPPPASADGANRTLLGLTTPEPEAAIASPPLPPPPGRMGLPPLAEPTPSAPDAEPTRPATELDW